MIRTLKLRFDGTTRLLMERDAGIDLTHTLSRQKKQITDKGTKKRTDEDTIVLMRLDFELMLYINGAGPFIPGWNVLACVRDGARMEKCGKDVERGVQVIEEDCPLLYKGPKDLEGLWADTKFKDLRGVKQGRGRVLKCRPQFPEWALEPTLHYDTEIISNAETLTRFAAKAGQYKGLGGFRPRFGRFSVTALSDEAVEGEGGGGR